MGEEGRVELSTLTSLDVFGGGVVRDRLDEHLYNNRAIGTLCPDGLEKSTGSEGAFIDDVCEFGYIDTSACNVSFVESCRVSLPHGGGDFAGKMVSRWGLVSAKLRWYRE